MKDTINKVTLDRDVLIGLLNELNAIDFENYFEYEIAFDGEYKDSFEVEVDYKGFLIVLDVMCSYYIVRGEVLGKAEYSLYIIKSAYDDGGDEITLDLKQSTLFGYYVSQKSNQ